MAGTKRQTKQKIQEPILGSLKLDSMLPSSLAKGRQVADYGLVRGFHCVARDGAVQAGSDVMGEKAVASQLPL